MFLVHFKPVNFSVTVSHPSVWWPPHQHRCFGSDQLVVSEPCVRYRARPLVRCRCCGALAASIRWNAVLEGSVTLCVLAMLEWQTNGHETAFVKTIAIEFSGLFHQLCLVMKIEPVCISSVLKLFTTWVQNCEDLSFATAVKLPSQLKNDL